ncbi:MAG: BON domain-containing protein [Rhodospirillaceae bacterium]|nr:BON domain-containing protein [Rhodospirillaceae bacterium]MBT5297054.1 BON domain-containing protein [Rhodospirillaceae bacterium]
MLKTVYLIAATLMILLPTVPAQAQFNPLSILKGAVEAAVEDRSATDIKTDLAIKTEINADVYEQDVMLTGAVENAAAKTKAEMLVGRIKGVKRLHNLIMVIKPVDKKKGAVEGFVDDTVIDQKINALLLDGSGVNVTNFRWRSVQGHVFLFGRALSASEKTKAAGIVKGIKTVLSVTDRVKVRPRG